MSEGKGLGTVGALSLSVVSSVSIVICNKALMTTLAFNFGTTLTSWHLLVTYCSLHVAQRMRFFDHKPIDSQIVTGFGILNGASIGFLNLSLGFNSVGFFQMTKLAIIPCTTLLETLFMRKSFSRTIKFSLCILLLGVGIATVTDLQLNILGSILSFLAVITTCIAQIVSLPPVHVHFFVCELNKNVWRTGKAMKGKRNISQKIYPFPLLHMTNTIQKKFRISSTQLLYQSCLCQSMTLFITGPFLDRLLTNQNVFAFDYTSEVVGFIILSCLISVSVNFSTFLVIGKTSAVTYQVLGHLKTCLVLTFGYVLLHDPFSWRNIMGMLVALVGMALYSYCCSIESQKRTNEATSQLRDGESDPLIGMEVGSREIDDIGRDSTWRPAKDFYA